MEKPPYFHRNNNYFLNSVLVKSVKKIHALSCFWGKEKKNTKQNTWCSKISCMHCLRQRRNLLDLWQHILKINLIAFRFLFKLEPNSFCGARHLPPTPRRLCREMKATVLSPVPLGVTGLAPFS